MGIKISELGAVLKARRGKKGLRVVADEIGGVSASTLSRIEKGKLPDIDTYMKVCNWLGEPAERFYEDTPTQAVASDQTEQSKEEIVYAHLRSDQNLDPQTAEALVTMIKHAYKSLGNTNLHNDTESS